MKADVFISHHTKSSLQIVEKIAEYLESKEITCWYAPRNTVGAYAGNIAAAINACKVFVLVLNRESSYSEDVLNELNLIIDRIRGGEEVLVLPFRISDETISEAAKYYVGRFHWIDAVTQPLEEGVVCIWNKIQEWSESKKYAHTSIIEEQEVFFSDQYTGRNKNHYDIKSRIPQVRPCFFGRDDSIQEIQELYDCGNRVIFIDGIGGIGKSELSKQYALRYRRQYDVILYVSYKCDIRSLIVDDIQIQIENCCPMVNESADEYFERKLQIFRTFANEKTLLIIDNYDVDYDPDFEEMIVGSHKVLVTSRNRHLGYPEVFLSSLEKKEDVLRIFKYNYGFPINQQEEEYLLFLLKKIEYHTYVIELIAKQMNANFSSVYGMSEFFDLFFEKSLIPEADKKTEGSIIGHICSIFSLANLSIQEKRILGYLSLGDISGVPAKEFVEWMGLKSFELINGLIGRSWIRREDENRISMHPLIIGTIRKLVHPDVVFCNEFFKRIYVYLRRTWERPVSENKKTREYILSVAEYFSPFEMSHLGLWLAITCYLWLIADYKKAIEYGNVIYENVLKTYGEYDEHTSYAAICLGACYYNSGKKYESMKWYKQSLKSLIKIDREENENLAMAYAKVARCYTWKYEKNIDYAKQLFKKSLQIRKELVRKFQMGEPIPSVYEKERTYNLEHALRLLGETYLEIGRMYQAENEWELAMENVLRQEELWNSVDVISVSDYSYLFHDKGLCLFHLSMKESDSQKQKNMLNLAIENFLKADECNSFMRGPDAIDTIMNAEFLADAYITVREFEKAKMCYQRALEASIRIYGEEDENVMRIIYKLEKIKE